MTNTLKNQSIFISGANGGIGKETVKLLLKEDVKHLTLATRSDRVAQDLLEDLGASPNTQPDINAAGGFDMTSPSAIIAGVDQLPDHIKYDVVFLQAGGMVVADNYQFINHSGTPIEKTIYQNVVGAYLTLTALERKGLLTKNARVVFPGGEGSRGLNGLIKKPEFTSVEELKTYIHQGVGKYVDINAIGISKFMSALLVQKLAELDTNKNYVWFSPGLTGGTNGLKEVAQPKRFIMEKIGFPIMQLLGVAQSPKQAAQKYMDALKGTYGISGDLLGAPEGKGIGKLVDQKPMNDGFTNQSFIQAFYQIIQNESKLAINQKLAS